MVDVWQKIRELAARNRPRRKPQLWEDLPLTARRRVAFELGKSQAGWLDRAHVVELSQIGFTDAAPALRIEVVPREMMNRAIFLYGAFEISETRLVQALLGPGMTFVDIGANIGYYTLIAARVVGATGIVHAFEPNDVLRARLEGNVRRNDLGNVTVHAEAIAQRSGRIEFFKSTWDVNDGISSLLPGRGRDEKLEVPCITLDDFVAGRGLAGRRIDLIKMDIEGGELLAMAGGMRTLSGGDAPGIIFEAEDLGRVTELLRPLGYQIRRIHYTLEDGLALIDPAAKVESLFAEYEAANYFAAKNEAAFETATTRARAIRAPYLRWLGRI